MSKNRDRRFEYVIDVENERHQYGVWALKAFRDRNTALAYAESLAHNNEDLAVTVRVEALGPRKNVLKASAS